MPVLLRAPQRLHGHRPPSLPAAPPPAPHCSLPRLLGGGGGCSLLKGPSPLLVAPQVANTSGVGRAHAPPGVPQLQLGSRDLYAPPPSLGDLRPLRPTRRGDRGAGVQGAPSGGAGPSHPEARHGIWKAEQSSAQGAGGWGQGLPGDKALRGGQKERERSKDRPDLERQAPPHSCTCTEGTEELRSCPPPRTDIASRTPLCATAALCGKGGPRSVWMATHPPNPGL